MKKNVRYLLLSFAVILITACSSTPNSILISVNQGVCVQSSMYSSNVTPSPTIANNPTNAPFCAAITVQNNNSGVNANNIQVLSSGLQLSYTVGSTVYAPTTMYDPIASGVASVPGESQIVGNVSIYDPKNCVTTNGANVIALNSGGVTCTFYLQLTGNSNPVGVYPTTLTYNYTNGNQNFAISTNLNQRVNLFAGSTEGLFFNNTIVSESASWQPLSTQLPTNAAVTAMISDSYGNLYASVGKQVYLYNGITPTQLGNNFSSAVISIAFDENGFLYAATNTGIFSYNPKATTPAWIPSDGGDINASSNIIGLKGSEYVGSPSPYVYAITATGAYSCATESSANSCHNWKQINTGAPPIPTQFYQNSMDIDPSGNLYIGSLQSAYSYSPGVWSLYTFNVSGSQNISGQIYGVWYNVFSTTNPVYFGEIPASANINTESSIYSCSSSICTPLISSSGNSVTGNTIAITTDGVGNIYIGGNTMNSPDFPSTITNTFGAYLLLSSTSGAADWMPITNGSLTSGKIQSLLVTSMLTSY